MSAAPLLSAAEQLLAAERDVMSIDDVLARLESVTGVAATKISTGYRTKCPVHDGISHDSLSVSESNDGTRVLLYCFSGCSFESIVEAAGLHRSNLGSSNGDRNAGALRVAPFDSDEEKCRTDGMVFAITYLKGRDGDLPTQREAALSFLVDDYGEKARDWFDAGCREQLRRGETALPSSGSGADAGNVAEAAQTAQESTDAKQLVYTGLELAAMEFDTPRPVCEGLLYEGCATYLIGAPKLAGKTTMSLDVARCIIAGQPWCGREVKQSNVLYLSEQTPRSFNPQVERAGLHVAGFKIMYYPDFIGELWTAIAAFAEQQAQERECGVVMIDNYSLWVGFKAEDENHSGPAMEAMRPIQQMLAAGLTVQSLTHSRKGGGSLSDAARGSGATAGLYDVLALLKGDSVPRRRVLEVTGRPFAETPEPFVVTLNDQHRYEAVGTRADVHRQDLDTAIMLCLSSRDKAKTAEDVVEACKADGFGHLAVKKRLLDMTYGADSVLEREKGTVAEHPRGYGYWRRETRP
jgi:AAA domain